MRTGSPTASGTVAKMFPTNTPETDRALRIVNIFLQMTLFNKHIKREDLWVRAFSRVPEQVQGNRCLRQR